MPLQEGAVNSLSLPFPRNMSKSALVLSDFQDKAFKREAMRAPDASRTNELQRWFNRYVPPQDPSSVSHTKTERPKTSFYERKRAELVERKARVTALLQLRERGLKASARRWPRYRDIATSEQNARAAKEMERRERMQRAAEAGAAQEARRAADARVAALTALRAAIDPDWECDRAGFSDRGTALDWPRLAIPMARPALPPDVCHEIALLATPYTIATLSLLCRAYSVGLRRLLYRNVIVGDRANSLVRTLASDEWMASMVKSLVFEDSFCAYIYDADWERAITTLVNLRHLTITHHVPLSWDSLPLIAFRLRSFTALGLVVGAWAAFLHLQPELQEIVFHSDLLADPPGPDALPVLRRLSARPSELSKFALIHPLESMVFWLFVLFRDTPQMLNTLKHLAIDEDHAWSRNSTAEQRLLMRAAAAIDEKHAPVLESLTMVCIARPYRAVSIERADVFSLAMRVKCTAPVLGTFHFCAADICRTWREWGQKSETVEDAPLGSFPNQDLILEKLSRLGATGLTQSMCERCNGGIQRHRCHDCFWGGALCATCLVEQHAEQPLHRIEVDHSPYSTIVFKVDPDQTWRGGHWIRDTLKNLGLRIQMGHGRGGHCIFPVPKDCFFIVDRHGIHDVAVDFCGCSQAVGTRANQLSQAQSIRNGDLPSFAGAVASNLDIQGLECVRSFLVLCMPPNKPGLSRAATRVRRERRGSVSPAREPRPNQWPTPFVPVAEQLWRPRRPRSQPIGAESTRRLQAALDSVPAAAEEMWQSAMQDLEQWAKDFPPFDPTPLLDPEPPVAPSSDQGDVWGRSGRTAGEGIESGWVAYSSDAEGVESRWATDQWINVLGMAARAMREPERREMLEEEYRRDQWLQQHREQRRRAWGTTWGVRDLVRARESVQREVNVETRRREGWALTFHDVTGFEYIE
ncbi:hypothetical protein DFH09DRAFT_1092896 [Mycena vulgaris]|nr:hypothetical protein DFH09DRAFT_1092896 [Mycena vulgaris]